MKLQSTHPKLQHFQAHQFILIIDNSAAKSKIMRSKEESGVEIAVAIRRDAHRVESLTRIRVINAPGGIDAGGVRLVV